MISEVDIRDWDKVDCKVAAQSLVDLGRENPQYKILEEFVYRVFLLKEKQLRKIPKLERE